MRVYETMFIVDPEIEEEERKRTIEKVKRFVVDGNGNIEEEKDMGLRELAYEIRKRKEGYYYWFRFSTEDPQLSLKLRDYMRLEPNIMRFIVVREDD